MRQQQEEDFKEVERQILRQQEMEKEKNIQLEKERAEKQQDLELKKIMEESIRLEKERIKNEMKQKLQQEPSEDDPNATLIVFRLPDGNRISRRFLRDDKISVISTNTQKKHALLINNYCNSYYMTSFIRVI